MVLKSRYFPNKEYADKTALFDDLRKNANDIIALKKADIIKACDKGLSVNCKSIVDFSKFNEQSKAIKFDDNYYHIAVNSTRILDSHDDLHWDGLWGKSVKENQGKNYLVEDHDLQIGKVIVRKEHIEMFTAKVPFSLLGYDYEGETEALIYKFPKDKVKSEIVKEWLDSGDAIEASVRMQYVTIELAMDSLNPQDEKEKERYDNYINQIANKDDFEYIPYFFLIKEAKNVRESSLVPFGSNSVTGNIRTNEPTKVTQEQTDPPASSQKTKSFYSHFLN
jgi:hypothetical protein